MKKILEAFARDCLSSYPASHKEDAAYNQLLEQVIQAEDALKLALDEEGKRLLASYDQMLADLQELAGAERFVYGYQLGVLMTMEVFSGRDALILQPD